MMDYAAQSERLRSEAARLLESGQVSCVIGLKANPEAGRPTPVIVKRPEDAQKLVWNGECAGNLAAYLREVPGKRAIAAKPCDVRSIINLLAENQLKREDTVIIGMECSGMTVGGERAPGCDKCEASAPTLWDVAVGADGGESFLNLPMANEAESVTDWLRESGVQLRRERFLREIDKCILCFSCRQACPGCYCESCFIERKADPWRQLDADRATKIAFHLTRAMHLAGRCTDCGACSKVCASGVDIHYLYRGIQEFIRESYDFEAGVDPEARPVMNSYSADDTETGFLGRKA